MITKLIQTKVPEQIAKDVDRESAKGLMTRAQFVRTAIAEKLKLGTMTKGDSEDV